jgi:hypothetical protein
LCRRYVHCTALHCTTFSLGKSHKGRGCCSLSWCPNSRLDVWAATCTVCVLHTLLVPQSNTPTCIQAPPPPHLRPCDSCIGTDMAGAGSPPPTCPHSHSAT